MLDQEIVAQSQEFVALLARAQRIALFPSTVLLEGETGAGKEVVANWIYRHSPRASFPFIKINCGAIPETLLESELFGYEKGAFTGAKNDGNPGLFELADKGTLLLDEVGELSLAMQVKLLRVLHDREIRRVGGSWSRTIDVRVIASTNKNLQSMVEQRLFREDLYYRLNVAYLYVPPLRERREDILPLLNHYLQEITEEFKISRRFSDEAIGLILNHNYPGNVRELRNLVEGLCVSAESELITLDYVVKRLGPSSSCPLTNLASSTLQAQLDTTEKAAIQQALQKSPSIRQAAKILGISHATLLRHMQKFGLKLKSV
ncbi:sigma-54 interaction domain-containing protein [Desulfitobacterium sp.]|uniref:sigma-54 interaction domain-containing protein n=1 Tax=Desulfitobacterium sp. TaxID=49981 RepID=UPI002C8E9B72|nr:sigma 54-interacting transcriptional regulator [Desulfitobacterium sp.]HVJ49817.1 sigma 54-interacting transcriptional regulator [Desulfitobacterium sp.]